MFIKKILKKYGNSLVIGFSKEEQSVHKLEEGQIIELEIQNG